MRPYAFEFKYPCKYKNTFLGDNNYNGSMKN